MWRKILAVLAAVMLPFTACAEPLDTALSDIFARYDTVGGIVAVGKDGQLVHLFTYGEADRQEHVPVTADTYFKCASVTKLITGMRVMQLYEDGLLDLDAPLGEILGYPVCHPKYPDADVTLRMLMSHTTGLTGNVPMGDSLKKLLMKKKNWGAWAPGTQYRYSNFAGALASVIEAVSGRDVNTDVSAYLFSPLGIDAAYRVHLLDEPEQAALRYNEAGRLARSRSFYMNEPWNGECDPDHHYEVGVGDLWIRAGDLLRLGMMMCAGGTLDGQVLLTDDTVAEMMRSQQGTGGVTVDSPYGLCVDRVGSLLPDRLVYGHQGHSEGVLCNLYWEPVSGLTFVLMTNGCDTRLDDYVAALTREMFAAVWARFGA